MTGISTYVCFLNPYTKYTVALRPYSKGEETDRNTTNKGKIKGKLVAEVEIRSFRGWLKDVITC